MQDLALELADSGVQVYAVHPAPAMDTELVRETGATPQSTVRTGLAVRCSRRCAPGPIRAARTSSSSTPRRAHEQAYDLEARCRLQLRL
jgi:NAD(P)-dependent dehydrogenase (short-subunit alcohol dehydrogenase family)